MTRISDPLVRDGCDEASVASLEGAQLRKRAEELSRRHGDYLRELARRLCRGHVDPEDLVQDVFEKTVRSPGAIPAGANERAWLSRVLHNLFIDRLRRKSARREEPMSGDPVAAQGDDAAWWESITADDIRAQLARLPDDQRITFELFAFHGKSYDEIAATLGIAKPTVGTRILRARLKLRALLTEERRDG